MPGNQVGHRPRGHIFMKLPKGQFFIRLVFFVLAILFFEPLRQRGNETVALALEELIKLVQKASVLSLALLSLDLEWFIVDHCYEVVIHIFVVARILIYRNSFNVAYYLDVFLFQVVVLALQPCHVLVQQIARLKQLLLFLRASTVDRFSFCLECSQWNLPRSVAAAGATQHLSLCPLVVLLRIVLL